MSQDTPSDGCTMGLPYLSCSSHLAAAPTHLILQMKDLREPMHMRMDDCCPSFFTVPVFRSRMRPVGTLYQLGAGGRVSPHGWGAAGGLSPHAHRGKFPRA